MITRISGKIVSINKDEGILTISNVGIGFDIYIGVYLFYDKFKIGDNINLFTIMIIKQSIQSSYGIIELYGFTNENQLSLFNDLTKVPKLSHKKAILIMSYLDYNVITNSIANNLLKNFTKIKGIGAKLSQDIIRILQEKYIAFNIPKETLFRDKKILKEDIYDNIINTFTSLEFEMNTITSSIIPKAKDIIAKDKLISLEDLIKRLLEDLN